MLVLTRKLMEKLYIGDAICVTVVRLEGGQVRLGIEAPREISVVRAELLEGPGRGRAPAADLHGPIPIPVPVPAATPGPIGGPTAPIPSISERRASARGSDSRPLGPSR